LLPTKRTRGLAIFWSVWQCTRVLPGRKVIDLDRETTFAEDPKLVKSVQRGLGSRGYRAGRLVVNPAGGIDSEYSIAKLQDWLREAIDA